MTCGHFAKFMGRSFSNFRASFLCLHWYFYLYNFPFRWSFSNISSSEVLLIINSLGFFFDLKDLLLPPFLKHIFTGYKIIVWQCLLVFLRCYCTSSDLHSFWWEACFIPVFALLYVMSFFLWLFKAFYHWLLPTWCTSLCFCSFAETKIQSFLDMLSYCSSREDFILELI